MLGFCATFFIFDVLVKLYSLPEYGVGIMLVKFFLAQTSVVFAMLGFCPVFFIINKLVKFFSPLMYGVGIVLTREVLAQNMLLGVR